MPDISTTQARYEGLLRWNTDDKLVGFHVQHQFVMRDAAGNEIGSLLGEAVPFSVEDFASSDFIQEVTANALERVNVLSASLEQAQSDLQQAREEVERLASVEAELKAARQEIARLAGVEAERDAAREEVARVTAEASARLSESEPA